MKPGHCVSKKKNGTGQVAELCKFIVPLFLRNQRKISILHVSQKHTDPKLTDSQPFDIKYWQDKMYIYVLCIPVYTPL